MRVAYEATGFIVILPRVKPTLPWVMCYGVRNPNSQQRDSAYQTGTYTVRKGGRDVLVVYHLRAISVAH